MYAVFLCTTGLLPEFQVFLLLVLTQMKWLLLVYSLTDCVTLFGLCCSNVTVLPGFSNYTHDGMMNNDGHICITMTQFVIKILSEVTVQNIEDKLVFCLTLSGQWQWPYVHILK